MQGAASLGLGAELCWKFGNGSLNAVSPWREAMLNVQFPNDRTGKWSETKAAIAFHNRAMGNPHDEIYISKEFTDQLKKLVSQNDYSKPGASGMGGAQNSK